MSFYYYLAVYCLIPVSLFGFSGNGAGSLDDPYQITGLEELAEINNELDAHYILMNNIDASETKNWNNNQGWDPIGTFEQGKNELAFTGTFNGRGNSIIDLYINRPPGAYIGFFGLIADGAEVRNLKLENVDIKGMRNVGAVIAYALTSTSDSKIIVENCQSSGTVEGNLFVGGFSSGFHANDEGSSITVNDCYNTATVKGSQWTGGFVAQNYVLDGALDIKNCSNSGQVQGEELTGGFCADLHSSNGTISISECSNTGKVSGGNSSGGFSGSIYITDGNVNINNCFNSGSINGQRNVGGICGESEAESANSSLLISNCYSASLTNGTHNVGGFCGAQDGNGNVTINAAYWDTELSGLSESDGGTGKTTAEMKTQSTFEGWDFDDVWAINPDINTGYPYLMNNSLSVSIEEFIGTFSDLPITVFPNPANETITIAAKDHNLPVLSIAIFDISGKEILKMEIEDFNSTVSLPVNNLQKGVYIISIASSSDRYSHPLLIE